MNYDFITIGGGSAGFAASTQVAEARMKTALIDRGPIGGLCSLNGCNPKKVLVRSSEVLDEIRHASKFGIDVSVDRIDWSRVIDRKESFTGGVTENSEQLLRDRGIDLIQGTPRFISPNRIAVDDRVFEATGFAIATGSVPRPLAFEGAEHVKTTNDILALRTPPEHLVCIGAGVVAFEFGQLFARIGSHVTILAHHDRALAGVEEEMVDALVEFSRELGIEIIFNAPVIAVQSDGKRSSVKYELEGKSVEISADFVLNAAGRVASLDGLRLEDAGVETDNYGIVVSPYLRSISNSAVFAAGDAHGRLQLSPIATYEGSIVAKNFLGGDTVIADYDLIPRAIYTIPPLASVGMTESEARHRGLNVKVVRNDMKEWKVYAIAGECVARSKVILDADSDSIIGVHMLGPIAGELIHLFAMAMKFGIRADDLKTMVFAYPTFASTLPSMLG